MKEAASVPPSLVIMMIRIIKDEDDVDGTDNEKKVHNNQDDGNLSMTSKGLGGKWSCLP